jgi:outer membrane scaffolding protein for murein synthesis (MipA/OmpV family)
MHCFLSFQRLASLAVSASLLASLPALAAENEKPVDGDSRFGLGLGAGLNRKPYKGFDNEAMVIPLITYENAWIRIAGPGVEGKLGRVGDVSFGLKGVWGFREGYKSSDADILSGMEERKGGIWIGPSLSWKNPIAKLSAEVLTDVSGHSQGQQAKLGLTRAFQAGSIGIMPRVGLLWQSDKVVDYYYGVRDSEARVGRAGYRGKATLSSEATVRFSYSLTARQSISTELGARFHGSGITDSPLVDKKTSPVAQIAYLYLF